MNQTENNLHWCFVLSFTEVHYYLNLRELLELNLVCRYLHFKLKPWIWNQFYLSKYLKINKLNSLSNQYWSIESRQNDQYTQLMNFIQSIRGYTTDLYLKSDSVYNLVTSVTNTLKNIQFLHLYWMNIPLERYNQLIDKLEVLEGLEFNSVNFIFSATASEYQNQVKFPSNLKRLFLIYCLWVNSDVCPNDTFADYHEYDNSKLNFTPILTSSNQNLLHLEKLICYTEHTSYISILNSFLSKNPQLKSCSLYGYYLNQTTIDLLGQCNQLCGLELDFQTLNSWNLRDIKYAPMNSIKRFTFRGLSPDNISMFKNFSLSCPNMTQLSLDYDPLFATTFNRVLSTFKQLETLIVTNVTGWTTFKNIQLSTLNIKFLELKGFETLEIDLKVFEHFSQLKRVTISMPSHLFKHPESAIQSYYHQFKNWRVFIYIESIQCYKNQL